MSCSRRLLLESCLLGAALFFSTLVPLTHGASPSHLLHLLAPTSVPGIPIGDDGYDYGVEGPMYEPAQNPPSALAARATRRKDPLNGFGRYTGGWNISDAHYWASVSSTALPAFVVAAVWFVGFGFCMLFVVLRRLRRKKELRSHPEAAYAVSLVLLIFFAIIAIVGCIVLYAGQERFNRSMTKALEYASSHGDYAVSQLKTISDDLTSAKQISVHQVFLPPNVQSDIDQTNAKLSSSSTSVADKTRENENKIRHFFVSVRLALFVLSAFTVILTCLGLLFSILGRKLVVYILVILGWIAVTGMFILCGVFLILHNAAGDSCIAMAEWVENPAPHTAMDEILPCADSGASQETVTRSKEATSHVVDLINEVITNVSNINFAPDFKPMYFNQSGPPVPILCNPFGPGLSERVCSSGEVSMNNATQEWSSYVCQAAAIGLCTTKGRLTPSLYEEMVQGINVSQALLNFTPFLLQLQSCAYLRETFGVIHKQDCPGLRRFSRWIYVGLAMVSTAVMLSLVFWVIYARERRHRLGRKPSRSGDRKVIEWGKHA